MVQEAINTLLSTLHKEQETYIQALTEDEVFEIRKVIRTRIRELNQRLVALYKALEDLERDSL
ncbi:MAG: hypothetical protein WDO19_03170 [Bacteroidota bacterium]